MFSLYDKVLIKSKNVEGTIIDIVKNKNNTKITVESNVKGKHSDGYGGVFPIFDCVEEDLKLL